MKIKNLLPQKQNLDSCGIAHFIIPLVIVLIIGIAGTFALVSSKAASNYGTIKIKAYAQRSTYIDVGSRVAEKCSPQPSSPTKEWRTECRVRNAVAVRALIGTEGVYDPNYKGGSCTYVDSSTKQIKKIVFRFGDIKNKSVSGARTIKCTPGKYTLQLDNGKDISTQKIHARDSVDASVNKGKVTVVLLGTYDR